MEFFENDIRSNLVFFWKSSKVLRKDEKRQNDLISSELPIFQQKRAPELELVYSHTHFNAIGFWTKRRTNGHTHALTHAHIFEKHLFQNPLSRTKSKKNGVWKNSRTFCLAHAVSIPAVYLLLTLVSAPHNFENNAPKKVTIFEKEMGFLVETKKLDSRRISPRFHSYFFFFFPFSRSKNLFLSVPKKKNGEKKNRAKQKKETEKNEKN